MEKSEIIKTINQVLRGFSEVNFGYLFGSVAEGFEREGSDVDVAIYLDEKLDEKDYESVLRFQTFLQILRA